MKTEAEMYSAMDQKADAHFYTLARSAYEQGSYRHAIYDQKLAADFSAQTRADLGIESNRSKEADR